jgi:phosphoribosylanthranilate isomerase
MIIKVCGMRDAENIRQVTSLGIDWVGMIFWDHTPRHVTKVPDISGAFRRVGVFVDATESYILSHIKDYRLDLLQLHGHESPSFLRNLRRKTDVSIRFIKAVSVDSPADMEICKEYEDCVDFFLFDTKCPTTGGSGRRFDWSVLQYYHGEKPFLLSGGIGPNDAPRLHSFHHPRCIGIDLNSRFELAPGLKDITKLKTFIAQL